MVDDIHIFFCICDTLSFHYLFTIYVFECFSFILVNLFFHAFWFNSLKHCVAYSTCLSFKSCSSRCLLSLNVSVRHLCMGHFSLLIFTLSSSLISVSFSDAPSILFISIHFIILFFNFSVAAFVLLLYLSCAFFILVA